MQLLFTSPSSGHGISSFCKGRQPPGRQHSKRSTSNQYGGSRRVSKHWRTAICRAVEEQAVEAITTEEDGNEDEVEAKSEEYSGVMQKKMGGSLVYRHEDGINWNDIADQLVVGSCLQTADDVDRVVEEAGIGTVLCLQMDSDMEHFDLDIVPIQQRCAERGDIRHIRYPIRDFDPFDLRLGLAGAVALVKREIEAGRKIYIHCTAGMGRAPATALAYLYWVRGIPLKEAHADFIANRPCNPRLAAIREASRDIVYSRGRTLPVKIELRRPFNAQQVQVAGLDVGWGQRVDLGFNQKEGHWVTERTLPAGRFPFKFIMDDRWTYSADHPTFMDGDTLNNYVDVDFDLFDLDKLQAKKRLLSEECQLTPEEREEICKYLDTLLPAEK